MKNAFLKKGSLKQWLYPVNMVSQKLILETMSKKAQQHTFNRTSVKPIGPKHIVLARAIYLVFELAAGCPLPAYTYGSHLLPLH